MKKCWILLLAVMLGMVLADGALAEITTEHIASCTYLSMVNDSNLLRANIVDGCYLMKIDGTQITEGLYNWNMTFENGHMIVEKFGTESDHMGLITSEGEPVMPMEYGKVEVLSKQWALGYTYAESTADRYDLTRYNPTRYMLIDTVDVYNLVSKTCVASLPRANFMEAEAIEDVINIKNRATGKITSYDSTFKALGEVEYMFEDDFVVYPLVRFRQNGHEGYKDQAGNVVIEPKYKSVGKIIRGYATISDGSKYGLMDDKGNVLVPPAYDSIYQGGDSVGYGEEGEGSYVNAGYVRVRLEDKIGFVNTRTGAVSPMIPQGMVKVQSGASLMYDDMEGNRHILAGDGVDTIPQGYYGIQAMDAGCGKLYMVVNEKNKFGVIDWHGNVVIPLEYVDVRCSDNGRYMMAYLKDQAADIFEIIDTDLTEEAPTAVPTVEPTAVPTAEPTVVPTAEPAAVPTAEPAAVPTAAAKAVPAAAPVKPSAKAAQEDAAKLAVEALMDSAIDLLETDPAANGAAAEALLDSAALMLGDSSVSVKTLLTSAKMLLSSDAAGSADSIKLILETAKTML